MKPKPMFIMIVALLILASCNAEPAAQSQPLPTLVNLPTLAPNFEAPQRTAVLFMDAWARFDYEAMYQQISFSSQEAIPLDTFRAAYESAHQTMTLESLSTIPRALGAVSSNGRTMTLTYDVTFVSRILGEFIDTNRNLVLIFDPTVEDWRVAWSVGDIFDEFRGGAQLLFEPRIPSRANIYDRDGEVLADQNFKVVQVSAVKEEIPNVDSCLTNVSQAINKPLELIRQQYDDAGTNWRIDFGVMEPTTYAAMSAQLENDCKATFRGQAARSYPRGSLMPHILGHVGYPEEEEIPALEALGFNQETLIGKSGIEKSWDDTLRGRPGGRLLLNSASGATLRILAEVASHPAESLWLTIDDDLQEFVLQAIGEAYATGLVNTETSKGGSGIIVDVNTGEILAMASYPSFEGNALTAFPAIGREAADLILRSLAQDQRIPQLNRPAQGIYTPGSVMKVVDSVAVLDSGLYTAETSYVCTGSWIRENDRRLDWWPPGHGKMTVSSGLTNSCNPFFYEAGYQLNAVDPFLLPNYARRMGLGAPTGLTDLPEAAGTIPDPDWIRINRSATWNYSHAINMAIGQGEVEVTPLQMVRMYAAIANGGTLYQPHLVREAGILDQRRFVADPQVTGVFDAAPGVLEEVKEGLCGVITGSTGTAAHIFRNSPLLATVGVCGKTGTAQDPIRDLPHSWFIAYAPAERPQIAVVVMIENTGDGSAVAAPITRRILEYYFFGTK